MISIENDKDYLLVLAGVKSSLEKEDEFKKYLKEQEKKKEKEKEQILKEQLELQKLPYRIELEQEQILNNWTDFFKFMNKINQWIIDDERRALIFKKIRKNNNQLYIKMFKDILENNLTGFFFFLQNNYDVLNSELDKLEQELLAEPQEVYFAINDFDHEVHKEFDCSDEPEIITIEYGSKVDEINESLYSILIDGKRYFTKKTKTLLENIEN